MDAERTIAVNQKVRAKWMKIPISFENTTETKLDFYGRGTPFKVDAPSLRQDYKIEFN